MAKDFVKGVVGGLKSSVKKHSLLEVPHGIKRRASQALKNELNRHITMSIKGAEQNSSLDLFRIPPTDLSTVKYRYVKIPPQTSSITPIQVYVERQSDLIDLSRSFVQLDLGFKTTENASLTARANNVGVMTSPANNIAHTLFKQINFRANGTLLTEQVDMYHLKAFIQTILNYDRNDGETILEPAGWRNEIDSPVTYTAANVKMDDDAYTALSINHQESIKRQRADATDYYAGGKRRILRMKPFYRRVSPRKMDCPQNSFGIGILSESSSFVHEWRS